MTLRAGPLIIAHRGSSVVAPENTLASFKQAIKDGADGLEFDVRLSRDGEPVVIHDSTLHRTANRPGIVSELTAAELGQIDVGSWFNEKHPQHARPGYPQETLPSLAQVFELTRGANQILYVEMKCETDQARPLAAAVTQLIDEYSIAEQVVVESFDLSAIAEVKRLEPAIRTAALFEPQLGRPITWVRRSKTVTMTKQVEADELALHHSLVTKRLVSMARDAGLLLVTWTVDDPSWIEHAVKLDIKALITNNPSILLAERARSAAV